MLNDSPSLLAIYTRLYSSVREKIKFVLSEKLTLRKNAIYINSKVDMIPLSLKHRNPGHFTVVLCVT